MTAPTPCNLLAEQLRGLAGDPHARTVLSKAFREAPMANAAEALHALADGLDAGTILRPKRGGSGDTVNGHSPAQGDLTTAVDAAARAHYDRPRGRRPAWEDLTAVDQLAYRSFVLPIVIAVLDTVPERGEQP